MSAFEVATTHIDALLTAGLWGPFSRLDGPIRWIDTDEEPSAEAYERGSWQGHGAMSWYQAHVRELTRSTADGVGAMLIAENRRSVNHRYDGRSLSSSTLTGRYPAIPIPW